jgi:hypothetical protein
MKKLWNEEFDLPIYLSGRMSRKFGYLRITKNRRTGISKAEFIKFS